MVIFSIISFPLTAVDEGSQGVPQGNVIFSCFINDLPSIVSSEVRMVTDSCPMV